MEIYLWRHGKAESQAPTGRDADRRIVPLGEQQTRRVAEAALSRGAAPRKIWTSPYARARSTADIVQGVLRCPDGLELLPELESGANPETVFKILRAKKIPDSFVLVGHMPDLSIFAQYLLGPDHESLPFETSAVLKISAGNLLGGSGTFGWLIGPSELVD